MYMLTVLQISAVHNALLWAGVG